MASSRTESSWPRTSPPILTGFDMSTGAPLLIPRTKPILVRHLLTHSAGAGYTLFSPQLVQWSKAVGRPLPIPSAAGAAGGGDSVDERFGYPFLFEPGAGWVYGSGIDWAGRLVEVITGQSLDEYVHAHVLVPVGVPRGGIAFFPAQHRANPQTGEEAYQLAGVAVRDKETGKLGPFPSQFEAQRAAYGGQGLHGGLGEYVKVLYSLTVDDGRILEPETAGLLFKSLLREPEAKQAMNEALKGLSWIVGWIPLEGAEYDWSAVGLLSEKRGEEAGHRPEGFLQWGGALNLSWFVDRSKRVCGAFGTQVIPPGDPFVRPFMKEFEELVYSKL
ncbi:hypothetical protein VTI74DRAFT_3116 [Chaetomium olivicolor]